MHVNFLHVRFHSYWFIERGDIICMISNLKDSHHVWHQCCLITSMNVCGCVLTHICEESAYVSHLFLYTVCLCVCVCDYACTLVHARVRGSGGCIVALMQLHRGPRLEKWFPPQYNGESVSQCCFKEGASSPGAFCCCCTLLRGRSEELL